MKHLLPLHWSGLSDGFKWRILVGWICAAGQYELFVPNYQITSGIIATLTPGVSSTENKRSSASPCGIDLALTTDASSVVGGSDTGNCNLPDGVTPLELAYASQEAYAPTSAVGPPYPILYKTISGTNNFS